MDLWVLSWTKCAVLLVVLLGVLTAPSSLGQQPLLRITAPVSGSVITEGQTMTITVSADPSVRLIDVLLDGPFPSIRSTSHANQFLQTIPTTIIPGIYHLTAMGMISTGDTESEPVAIDVEPRNSPIEVTGDPTLLVPDVGDQFPLRVLGTFPDGSKLDLTNSSRTTYFSYDTKVAAVSSTGMVTGVGPGQTFIRLHSGIGDNNAYGVVVVQVPQPPPPGPTPVVTNVTPLRGEPGKTQVTITGYGFGATRGNGFVQLGTLNATVIAGWSDTQIVATVPVGSSCGAAAVNQNGKFSNSLPFPMSTPTINSISPISVLPGMQMTIGGCGFGAVQNGFVSIGNKNGIIADWSDAKIVITVPDNISRGTVYVQQNDVQSNAVFFGIGR
jgi:hypothetical protein